MAELPGPSPPPSQTSLSPRRTRGCIIQSLFLHNELFEDINNNNRPQGDVRLRHLGVRALRGNYFDARVKEKERELGEFWKGIRNGELDPNTEEVWDTLERLMDDLDRELDRSSRALEQDTRAAEAPVVNQYFMDTVFRHHLERLKDWNLAPNSELKTSYGSQGDLVPQDYCAVRSCDDDFFHRLILKRLLVPINDHIYKRCEGLYNTLFHRVQGEEADGLDGGTLDRIVSALECMVSVFFVAGPVILLYNLPSMKDRIIATTFLSLMFPYAIVFLSKEARAMFPLTAGFWAVMIVFIATSDYDRGRLNDYVKS